jgi:putative chitinase
MPFSFDFKPEHTRQILKGNAAADEWHAALVDILPKWKITTPNRVAAFMAQTSHESGNYKTLEENLNYGWEGLRKTFSRYFPTDALAKQYERQPEKIANRVYDDANRVNKMGNTAPGDGWKYRGRGIIQLTGKNNYLAFAADIGMTLDQVVEYVQTKKGAIESAAWFWSKRNINAPADAGDIDKVSTLVNGGTIGLTERREKYKSDLAILGSAPLASTVNEAASAPASNVLKRGSTGPDVVKLQKALGVTADGSFGAGTETALKQWQAGSGMTATGVADPATLKKIAG